MDDWDTVSSTTPAHSATDPSDAVSPPQPQQRKGGQSVKISLSRHLVLLGLAGLVVASLASGITWFAIHHVSGNSIATAPAATEATTSTDVNITATAQAVATATMAQQIYTQATSGTPAIDDPLSDDRNSWGVFTTDWGGQCAFTGGAYHLTLSKPGFVLFCNCANMASLSNFNNFAVQVQLNIVQGNEGGIVFGQTPDDAYRIDISSVGTFILYQHMPKSMPILQNRFSPAIKTGLNQMNVLTVIVNNGNFYFYVNGQFVTSDNFGASSRGGGDLAAQSNDQATDVVFSNLKVWTL